jgi:uncharacterized protein (DUF305 family)
MPAGRESLWKINRLREGRTLRHGQPARRGIFVPLPTTALALGILAALIAGAAILGWTFWPKDPGNDSVEAGFLRDMFTHHAQAVEMSMIIRDRTEDPDLLALATDIALSQSTQMGAMQGYLDIWGLPLTGDDPAMTWMDHPTTGPMPGMATSEQVEQLRTLPVEEAEVLYLQLMIRHHQGGVEMAQAALDRSDQKQVTFMANRIVMLQESEITTMNQMLEERGQSPITDPLPESHEDHEG